MSEGKVHVVSGVSTDWVIGWKIANAYIAPDLKTLQFSPVYITANASYGVDAIADCLSLDKQHEELPPFDDCKCGFNAWHDLITTLEFRSKLPRYGNVSTRMMPGIVVLRVGLCGDVIEGTKFSLSKTDQHWGYRAERQKVADVYYEDKCYTCSNTATHLGVIRQADERFGCIMKPACQQCETRFRNLLDPFELTRHNDVDVHLGLPSDE